MPSDLKAKLALGAYLARMEFEKRFAGTIGGRFWLFAGPLATILVIWLALDLGLGLRSMVGPGYGLSLAVGLTAWLFFADGVNGAAGAIVGSPHLVKKVVFPVELLPLAHIAAVVHLVLVVVVLVVVLAQGISPGLSILMLPFWAICLLVLVASTGLLVAGLNVLFRDVGAALPNVISFLFWVTPIVWPLANVPAVWRPLAIANPAALVLEGYRSALIGSPAPVGAPGMALLVIGLGLYALAAASLFRRMRPWFADVL
jgi:teichoic acid transport system permease protein